MMRGETIYIDDMAAAEKQNNYSQNTHNPNVIHWKIYDEIEFYEKLAPVYDAEPSHSNKLGVDVELDGCNVSLWAENAELIDICLFDKEDHDKTIERWRLIKDGHYEQNSFSGFIPGMKAGDIYGIRIHGLNDNLNHQKHDYGKLLIDPYARALTDNLDSTSVEKFKPSWNNSAYAILDKASDSSPYIPRCVVVDEAYDWSDDKRPNIPKHQMMIYEGHVKGLTYLNTQIPDDQRGTYAGIASQPFMEHLKGLGITSLELMPIQHFVSEPHLQSKNLKNYWGYNTLGFFAPHAEYSSAGQNGEQVKEFKDMVKTLHSEGIEVILDVVYNHTPEGSEQGPIISFKGLGEQSMYHLSPDGYHCNYSGCGNTINASTETGMNFILQSLHYWAEEMHVDGFRFDLATILAREDFGSINMQGRFMSAINNDPVLSKLKIIAEPWDCGAYELGRFNDIWQEWNDQFRDTVRDFWCGRSSLGRLATSLACGSLPHTKSINFITAHDGLTLMDVVSFNEKHNYENNENNSDGTNDNHSYNFGFEGQINDNHIKELRIRSMRNMLLSLFISAGTPMLSHGDEIMRTQNGNNNAYCQDNEISWLNWDISNEQSNFYNFVSSLIKLRKDHPILSETSVDDIKITWLKNDGNEFGYNDPAWNDNQRRTLGMMLSSTALSDNIIYYANGSSYEETVKIPEQLFQTGEYEVLINTADNETLGYRPVIDIDTFAVKALSSIVLRRKNNR